HGVWSCRLRLPHVLGESLRAGTQLFKNPKRDLFRSLASLPGWPDTRGTSVLAGARHDQLARSLNQHAADPIQRLAESNPAWVSVVDVKIGLEQFLGLRAVRGSYDEIFPVDLARRAGRAFTNGCAKIPAIAHHQECRH